MELDEQQLQKEYFREKLSKTLAYGKLFSVGSFIMISIISLLEYYTHHRISLFYCRLMLLIPSTAFIFLSFKVLKEKTNLILPFHLINLLGGILMMVGLVIVKSHDAYLSSIFSFSSMTGGIVAVIFILFIFSTGAEKYLGYILVIPLLALIAYLFFSGNGNWIDISFFINPLIAAMSAGIFSFYQEKLKFQEFKMRKLAEIRKDLLEIEMKEKNLLEKELRKQAVYDELTGVFNRRAGFELLHAKGCTCKLALCYIDLDNLKEINDQYGHTVGDAMIVTLCNSIKYVIREDDFIFRMGGDEFIVVFHDCTTKEAELAIKRIKQQLAGDVHGCKINFSYGISEHSPAESTINQLIEDADNNMYKDKLRKKSPSLQ